MHARNPGCRHHSRRHRLGAAAAARARSAIGAAGQVNISPAEIRYFSYLMARGEDSAYTAGSDGYCSPRHRMPFNSSGEG